jgi:magnesium-transporting ATPase (P-type)
VLNCVKNIIKNGSNLSSENEQLIVIKFNLLNSKEIYDRLNGTHISDESLYVYNLIKKDTQNLNELYDNLSYSFHKLLSEYRKGFGIVFAAFLLTIISFFIIYLTFNSSEITNLEISSIYDYKQKVETYLNISKFISIVSILMFITGFFILYKSSKLNNNG